MTGVAAVDAHGRRVQAMFTDIAPGYDRANRIMSMGTDVRWRRRAVTGLLPGPRSAGRGRVLDLCAGTLDATVEIHRQYPQASIVAGDFSAAMLAAGEKRLPSTARSKVQTLEVDAHELPFEDDTFDAAFCAFGMRNLSDVPRALGELARCLRPGANLTVLEFFRPEGAAARTFHAVYNNTVLPAVGWACTGNLAAYRYLPQSMSRFSSVAHFAELMRAAGFTTPTSQALTLGVASIVRAQAGRSA